MPAPSPCTLTPAQQGMLFHTQLAQREGIYSEQLWFDLFEDLDTPRFEAAWRQVIQRHEVLRASFHLDPPFQIFHDQVDPVTSRLDWCNIAESEREARWMALLAEDRDRPWIFELPCLMRLSLVAWEAGSWRILLSAHHALFDGRSFVAFFREVFEAYSELELGASPEWKAPRSFADFAAWLAEGDPAAAKDYWQERLRGFDEPNILPSRESTGSPRRREILRTELDEALSAELTALAHRNEVTLNTLAMGAWALLIGRTCPADDVVFGVVVASRWPRMDSDRSAIGPFMTTLPFRVQLPPDVSLIPWLKDLRTQWLALRDQERTPLVEIQRWSEVPAGTPMFESMMMFEHADIGTSMRMAIPNYRIGEVHLEELPETPLTFTAYGGQALALELGFAPARFEPEAITRMLGHLQVLLRGMVEAPERAIGELPMMTQKELHTQLLEWNAARWIFPADRCVHELFEDWGQSRPDVPAVVFEGQALTYGELDHRANRLAHHLRAWGVGPEVLVGLCAERSLELMVGILAILKAGGAYVPLNPDDPAARLALVLEQARVPVLLTQARLVPGLPPGDFQIFLLDQDEALLPEAPAMPPASGVGSENLAYVIFTSGSTGRPKGVMVSHRNVLGFIHAYQHVTQDREGRIGTNVAPFNFDTSVEEFFSCLCFGGTVHILRPEHSADGAYFAHYLVDHGITTSYIVPAMLAEVAAHLSPMADKLSLKCLLTGLHAKKEGLFQRFRDLAPELRIINAYGPTETTYGATAHVFHRTENPDRDAPIGLPFPGYQTYIVDAHLRPVPVGTPGELLVGGIGIARGYLDQPELTAQAFIPDPFRPDSGGRLYRTGDRCRYLSDGTIEFLGRVDHQVKIRGYRVELGEVEQALSRHGAIKECVVLAMPDVHGGTQLVAYLAGKDLPAISTLRAFLKKALPEYMVPSVFVSMEVLPRTTAGKVDRRALPVPQRSTAGWKDSHASPSTANERYLAQIWTDVLKLDRVSIHDVFFEIGGQSLLAVQVIARIRRERGLELPLKKIFDLPTIAQLAPLLDSLENPAALPIQPLPRMFQPMRG